MMDFNRSSRCEEGAGAFKAQCYKAGGISMSAAPHPLHATRGICACCNNATPPHPPQPTSAWLQADADWLREQLQQHTRHILFSGLGSESDFGVMPFLLAPAPAPAAPPAGAPSSLWQPATIAAALRVAPRVAAMFDAPKAFHSKDAFTE